MKNAEQLQEELFKKVCKDYPEYKVIKSSDIKMVYATKGNDYTGHTISFNVNGRSGKTCWSLGRINS
jgi:hypothetical protein